MRKEVVLEKMTTVLYGKINMKKLILSIMLVAFAAAVQAGDDKATATQEKPACCAKAKAACADKAECPMAKQAKAQCAQGGKTCSKDAAAKQVLASPKAASDATK